MARRFSIYGDSISTFHGAIPAQNRLYYDSQTARAAGIASVADTWWARVIAACGGRLCQNASFSGAMVEGAGFPAAESAARAAQVTPHANEGEEEAGPTDILLFQGINDYGWGGAAAQAAGRSEATPKCLDLAQIPPATAGNAPADALQKFAAAYLRTFQELHHAAPAATIWAITLMPAYVRDQPALEFCHALRGITLQSYNAAIKAATHWASCAGIDARLCDVASADRAYESTDGTHPTALGMQQIANMTLAAMTKTCEGEGEGEGEGERVAAHPTAAAGERIAANPTAAAGERAFGQPALRTCFKPTCVGCEYARGVGNEWSCVCERGVRQ